MILWRITPTADPDDPRWQGRRIWAEVIVAAGTSADAVRVAAEAERDPDAPLIGNESDTFRSGFEDEKLYAVRRIPDEARGDYALGRHVPGVLRATPLVPSED